MSEITNSMSKESILERIDTLSFLLENETDEFQKIVLLNDKRKLYHDLEQFDIEDLCAGEIINIINDYLSKGDIDDDTLVALDKILRQNYIVRGRKHIDEFWIAMEYDRKPENQFYLPRREVLRPIIEAQQEILDGKLDFLAVSQPKRTGKTTTGIGLILMMAGRDIRKGVLATGAGATLTDSFYSGIMELIMSPEYNFFEIFPEAKIADTSAADCSVDFGVVKRFPSITCRSIEGKIVGATEASSLLYLDDCVANMEEARNYDRLDKKWDIITGDVLGRRIEGCPIVICGTRYSVKDPIGRLIDIAEEVGWRYKELKVPALDDNDESNWDFCPGAKGSFSSEYYRRERKIVTKECWESEFQQEPFEAKGLLFNEESLNYYTELPDKKPDAILCKVDVAKGGGDFLSAPVGYLYGDNVYINDWLYNDGAGDVTKPLVASLLLRVRPDITDIESNNGGDEYGLNVKENYLDKLYPHHRLNITFTRTSANKETKILVASDNIKKHFYFRADWKKDISSDYYKAMKELTSYSPNGKMKHDDGTDSIAMMENMVNKFFRPVGLVTFGKLRNFSL